MDSPFQQLWQFWLLVHGFCTAPFFGQHIPDAGPNGAIHRHAAVHGVIRNRDMGNFDDAAFVASVSEKSETTQPDKVPSG